jgi:hypothetical protein
MTNSDRWSGKTALASHCPRWAITAFGGYWTCHCNFALVQGDKKNNVLIHKGAGEVLGAEGDDTLIGFQAGTIYRGEAIDGAVRAKERPSTWNAANKKATEIEFGYLDDVVKAGNYDFFDLHPQYDRDTARAEETFNLKLDGGAGKDWVVAIGGDKVTTIGGIGRDWIFNTSDGGMMRWGFGRGVIGMLISAFALGGCSPFTSDESSYRFKMTVEVETPAGLRTGSSVYEVSAWNKMKLTSEEGSRDMGVKGEAVAVDIGPGQTLFALLKTNAHYEEMGSLSMQTLDPLFTQKYDTVGSAARIASGKGISSPAEVDPKLYPMLVTFTNIADPKSVQKVEPGDLAAGFGAGVRLKRITVAVTQDAVTTGIGKRLAWLPQYYDKMLDGDSLNRSQELANNLSQNSFQQGLSK